MAGIARNGPTFKSYAIVLEKAVFVSYVPITSVIKTFSVLF